MKHLLIIFLTASLFMACKDNKQPLPGEILGNGFNNVNKDDLNKKKGPVDDTRGPNTGNVHNQLFTACLQQLGNDPQAKAKCDCWVGKVEAKFPNTPVEQISEQAANELAVECMKNFGGGDVPADFNPDYNVNAGEDINGGNAGGNWTQQQRQQYIQGCSQSAQQSGLSAQQASTYCDCMTRKVEQKYTFDQAGRMSAADFQTPEWQQAIYDCYPKQQQYEY